LFNKIKDQIIDTSLALKEKHCERLGGCYDMIDFLLGDSLSPLTENNVTVLLNGEQKFPHVIEAMESARQHIHMEYYIYEDDKIGNRIKDVLIRKAKEGVQVRIIYDDFGSSSIRKRIVKELKEGGVQIFPFYVIRLPMFASRINYRDHRKIIIVDGVVGFTGGINISDRYINDGSQQLYWRDTHLMMKGAAAHSLQFHFLSNWNFCSSQTLGISPEFFPEPPPVQKDHLVQIICGGPDYPRASIMLCFFTAITGARNLVYITTPYFIPNESINNALKKAALSGKDVRLLVPETSDSRFVNAASRFYFLDLLETGVRIFRYKKGFMHAKTIVVDDSMSIVGTANIDFRSFDLNFEINAVVYGHEVNQTLRDAFLKDLDDSEEINLEVWRNRSKLDVLGDSAARIGAPLL
jgi:cardiolipin synthase